MLPGQQNVALNLKRHTATAVAQAEYDAHPTARTFNTYAMDTLTRMALVRQIQRTLLPSSKLPAWPNRAPTCARHQFKVWTTYQLPAELSDWTVGGGVDLQSATYVSGTTVRVDGNGNVVESNIPFDYKQSGYAVWNALLRYRVDDHWTVSLNANNLFDKSYYQTVSSAANGNFYGDPRNYMLTLRGTF